MGEPTHIGSAFQFTHKHEPIMCPNHPDREIVYDFHHSAKLCKECWDVRVKAEREEDERRVREYRERDADRVLSERCGKLYASASLDDLRDLDAKFLCRLRALAETMQSAVFFGPTGTGKTHSAAAIFRRWYIEHDLIEFKTVPELLDELRAEARDSATAGATVRGMRGVAGLVLDDLGGERVTDFASEGLLRILDWRSRDGSPTLVTTNLDEEPLRASVGDRAVSRLLGLAGGNVFRFTGRDRREV